MNTPFKPDYQHQSAYGNKHFAGIEFFDTLFQPNKPSAFRAMQFVDMINDSVGYVNVDVCQSQGILRTAHSNNTQQPYQILSPTPSKDDMEVNKQRTIKWW